MSTRMQMSYKISMVHTACGKRASCRSDGRQVCAAYQNRWNFGWKMSGGKKEHAHFRFRINPASHQYSLSYNMVFHLVDKIPTQILSFNFKNLWFGMKQISDSCVVKMKQKNLIFIAIQDKMSANMFSRRCACTFREHNNYIKLLCRNLRLLSIAQIIDGLITSCQHLH